MRFAVVTKTQLARQPKARCCGKVVRPGEVILTIRFNRTEAPAYAREVHLHRRCMCTLLEAGPLDSDERAFNEIVEAIVATGDPYCQEAPTP